MAVKGADTAISYIASYDKSLAGVEKLRAKLARATTIKADKGSPSAGKALMQEVVSLFGKLDIVANNTNVAW